MTGYSRRTKSKLKSVSSEIRQFPSSLFFGQELHQCLKPVPGSDRAGFDQHLSAFYVIPTDATKVDSDVLPGTTFIKSLSKRFHADACGPRRSPEADDLDLIASPYCSMLDHSSHHRATARYRKHVFDLHQERHEGHYPLQTRNLLFP